MKAIITYNCTTHGCQKRDKTDVNSDWIDWLAGGETKDVEIEFTPNPKLSNKITAMKAFMEIDNDKGVGNTIVIKNGFKVKIIEE